MRISAILVDVFIIGTYVRKEQFNLCGTQRTVSFEEIKL